MPRRDVHGTTNKDGDHGQHKETDAGILGEPTSKKFREIGHQACADERNQPKPRQRNHPNESDQTSGERGGDSESGAAECR